MATAKDYVMIATVLKRNKPKPDAVAESNLWCKIVLDLALAAVVDNKRFNEGYFLKQCGWEEK